MKEKKFIKKSDRRTGCHEIQENYVKPRRVKVELGINQLM